MPIQFHFLPAGSGDSILIRTDDFIMLIDSGDTDVADELKHKIHETLKNRKINLIILTHIDDDHIGGIQVLLDDQEFLDLLSKDCQVWINYPDKNTSIFPASNNTNLIGFRSADQLMSLVYKKSIQHKDSICCENNPNKIWVSQHIYLDIISPNLHKLNNFKKEYNRYQNNLISASLSDYKFSFQELTSNKDKTCSSINNGASIAFILTYIYQNVERKFLFLADAHTGIIRKSLIQKGYSDDNPLIVDFVKISHHGSKYNTSKKLLNLISTNNFIFLTENENILPHKQTIERIINRKHKKLTTNLIFNYECTTKKLKNDGCISKADIEILHLDNLIY